MKERKMQDEKKIYPLPPVMNLKSLIEYSNEMFHKNVLELYHALHRYFHISDITIPEIYNDFNKPLKKLTDGYYFSFIKGRAYGDIMVHFSVRDDGKISFRFQYAITQYSFAFVKTEYLESLYPVISKIQKGMLQEELFITIEELVILLKDITCIFKMNYSDIQNNINSTIK